MYFDAMFVDTPVAKTSFLNLFELAREDSKFKAIDEKIHEMKLDKNCCEYFTHKME